MKYKEFFENYEIYKIELNNYDLKQYVEEELITSEIINQYFEENSEEFIEPKRYTYEQIISVDDNENDFNLLKENHLNLVKEISFPDHYNYSKQDLIKLHQLEKQYNIEKLYWREFVNRVEKFEDSNGNIKSLINYSKV